MMRYRIVSSDFGLIVLQGDYSMTMDLKKRVISIGYYISLES
jgi:hypothetical protein